VHRQKLVRAARAAALVHDDEGGVHAVGVRGASEGRQRSVSSGALHA